MNITITSVLRRFGLGTVGLVLLGLVAACSGPSGPEIYRDQGRIIASTTRFDVERFWGDWQVRETFPSTASLREVALLPDRRGGLVWREARERCEGTTCVIEAVDTPAREGEVGRLQLIGPNLRELWVMWVDADFRTAAVGTADGRIGYIIDRRPTGGADRIKAARDVLDFNGFDISKLQTVTP